MLCRSPFLVEDNSDTLNTLIMNLQPSQDKDHAYGHAKVLDFDQKYQDLKENLQKPNELKEYEDFDLKCIETSFHQQRTELKRKSSNKKNPDAIVPVTSAEPLTLLTSIVPKPTSGSLQRKRSNIEMDIRPCEPNER
jgi:hypothetical protein